MYRVRWHKFAFHFFDGVNQKRPHPNMQGRERQISLTRYHPDSMQKYGIALHFARDLRLRESTTHEILIFTARLGSEFHNHVCLSFQSTAIGSLET